MAEKIEVEVVAKTSKAAKALKDLENTLEGVQKSAQKNREGFELLDQATGGYAGKIKDLSGSVKGAITGAKGFIKTLRGVKGALISTGIGALVVALGLIVAYWDDIKGAVDGTTRSQREGLAAAEKMKEVTTEQLAVTNSMENTLKLQGKTEKEIKDLKVQQTNEIILATEAQLAQQESMKKTQIEAAERNRNIAAGIIAFLTLPIGIILGSVDAISQTLAQLGIIEKGTSLAEDFVLGAAEMIFDPEEVATEADATIKETEAQLRKLKNSRDGFILKDKEDKKKKAQEDIDNAVKAEQDRIDALEAIRKGEIDTEAERRAEKLRLVNEEYEELKASAIKYGEDTADLEEARLNKLKELNDGFDETDRLKEEKRKEELAAKKLLEQEALIEELELTKEFELLNFEEQKEILNQRDAILLADETLSEEQRTELAKQSAEARAKVVELENKAKEDAMASYAGALSKIGGLVGKETQAGKMAASAGALISTYLNASKARTSQLAIATPDAPIRAALAMGVEIASGLQQVKAINSVKVPKASGGGGATPSGSGAATGAVPLPPSFNIVGASETSQLADAVAGQANQPVQAYVVANDVTSAQSLQNNIIEGATIG